MGDGGILHGRYNELVVLQKELFDVADVLTLLLNWYEDVVEVGAVAVDDCVDLVECYLVGDRS